MEKSDDEPQYIRLVDLPKQKKLTDEAEVDALAEIFPQVGGEFMECIESDDDREVPSAVYGTLNAPVEVMLLSDSRVFLGMIFEEGIHEDQILQGKTTRFDTLDESDVVDSEVYYEAVERFVELLSDVIEIDFSRKEEEWVSPVMTYDSLEELVETLKTTKIAVQAVLKKMNEDYEAPTDKVIQDVEQAMDNLGRRLFEAIHQAVPVMSEEDGGMYNFMLYPVNLVLNNRIFTGRNIAVHKRLTADPAYKWHYDRKPYSYFHYRIGGEGLQGQGGNFNGDHIEVAPDFNVDNMLDRLLLYRQLLLFGKVVEYKEHADKVGIQPHEFPDLFYPNRFNRLVIIADEGQSYTFLFEALDLLLDGEFGRLIKERGDINPFYLRSKLNASEDQLPIIEELIDLAKVYYSSGSSMRGITGSYVEAVTALIERKREPGTYHTIFNLEMVENKPAGEA